MKKYRLTGKYIFISFVAVVFSFFFHELAHWVTGELLGYQMGMSLNKTFFTGEKAATVTHEMLVSAAGPLFTLFQAFVFFWLLKKGKNEYLYPFLFFTLYMRLLAGGLNLINLNDEGRISIWLGMGSFSISIFVCALLFWLIYKISKENNYGLQIQLTSLGLVMVFSTVVILGDHFLHLHIIR